MGFKSPSRFSRREFTKVAGLSGVGVSALAGRVSASSDKQYVGVAYDPQTHEIIGNAEGNLVEANDRINGVLKVNGDTVPLNRHGAHSNEEVGDNRVNGNKRKYIKKMPLKNKPKKHKTAHFSSIDTAGITGFIRHPDGRKIAFAVDKESRSPTERIVEALEMTKGGSTVVKR